MKRIFVIALAVTSMMACNEQKEKDTVVVDTTTDTSTTVIMDNTTVANPYTPEEGDVIFRNGKVMVYRNNTYVESDKDVTLDSGIVVKRNGEVTREGVVIKMDDGEAVTKTGRFFDKTGQAIENAWDATKRGVSKAASAVGKGAKKVGEEVKDAVH